MSQAEYNRVTRLEERIAGLESSLKVLQDMLEEAKREQPASDGVIYSKTEAPRKKVP